MGMFTSINIASTGMAAERLRSDVISNNIANASTTRTQEGGAFKKSTVVMRPVRLHKIHLKAEWFMTQIIQTQLKVVQIKVMLNILMLIL